MIDKLQAIARLMIIPTVGLYLCGFICMTGYLARFGIVTFDIINARFLIAGMHVLLPSAFTIWLSWKIYKQQLDRKVYTYAGSLPRFAIYSEILVTPSVASYAFGSLYAAANFDKLSDPDAFRFGPLGSFDVAGKILAYAGIQGFGTKLAFYFCFYSLVIVVPAFALVLAYLRRPKPPRQVIQLPVPANEPAPAPAQPRIVRFFLVDGIASRSIVLSLDIIFISITLAAWIYSWWRIRSEVLDASSLGNLRFDQNLLLSWLYATNFSILFFLIALPVGVAQFNFSNFGSWINPSNFADALQRLAAPVLASLFLFGATIFPRLPIAIGGGMPRQVSISFKTSTSQYSGKKYLLGESEQFFFIVQVNGGQRRAFQVNKDMVEAVETWEDYLPPPKSLKPTLTPRPGSSVLPRVLPARTAGVTQRQ